MQSKRRSTQLMALGTIISGAGIRMAGSSRRGRQCEDAPLWVTGLGLQTGNFTSLCHIHPWGADILRPGLMLSHPTCCSLALLLAGR